MLKTKEIKNSKHFQKKMFIDFVTHLITTVGENVSREGLRETPQRVFQMYKELLSGYFQDIGTVFKTFKSNGYNGLITLTNIDFYSLCEHHLIPFLGKIHIGYVPDGKILGLSKFIRLIEILTHRLQTQEYLTEQLCNIVEKNLKPKGLIVVIEAQHLCMRMRGVKKKILGENHGKSRFI